MFKQPLQGQLMGKKIKNDQCHGRWCEHHLFSLQPYTLNHSHVIEETLRLCPKQNKSFFFHLEPLKCSKKLRRCWISTPNTILPSSFSNRTRYLKWKLAALCQPQRPHPSKLWEQPVLGTIRNQLNRKITFNNSSWIVILLPSISCRWFPELVQGNGTARFARTTTMITSKYCCCLLSTSALLLTAVAFLSIHTQLLLLS